MHPAAKHRMIGRLALGFLLGCGVALAVEKAELKIGKTVQLPDVGLTFKIMPKAQEQPLPAPEVRTMFFRQGANTWKTNGTLAVEFWRQEQFAGRWLDPSGNTLTLAFVKKPLPATLANERLSREDYASQMAAVPVPVPQDWNAQTLAEWAADFTGASSASAQVLEKHPLRLDRLIRINLEGRPNAQAYAFTLNPKAAGQYGAAPTLFFVLFELNPSAEPGRSRTTIEKEFLESIAGVPGKGAGAAPAGSLAGPPPEAPASGKPSAAGDATVSAEFEASRQQVLDSIRNMKDWWFAETPNYIILSNFKTKNSALVNHLRENIEILRAAYEQFMPPRQPVKAVSVIRVFATAEEFFRYLEVDDKTWLGGLWNTSHRELVIRPPEGGNSFDQSDRLMRVIYHEAFHQYQFYAFDEAHSSLWFNEGHACFYENAVIRGNKFDVQEDPGRAATIDEIIRANTLNFRALPNMDAQTFYAKDVKEAQRNYASAWAMIYYLRKSVPLDKASPYAGILDRYENALWETRQEAAATQAAFAGIDLDAFQKDFIKFWKNGVKRSSAQRNKIFQDFNAGQK